MPDWAGLSNPAQSFYLVGMKLNWNSAEKAVFKRLTSPFKIQQYLDSIAYNLDPIARSPRGVMLNHRSHCLDGALFGAAALEQLGFPPLLMDLRANQFDDDHVLAIFRINGRWGAVAKSNYTGTRYRDPVYRNLRELAVSYFHIYFNLAGKKTLREYSIAFDLRRVKDISWRTTEQNLDLLGDRLDATRHFHLIDERTEKALAPADDRLFKAETLGLDPRGAFKVRGAKIPL